MSKCKYDQKLLVAPKEERTDRAENTSQITVSSEEKIQGNQKKRP